MDALKALSSLHCELKIIKAKNIEVTSNGFLFVRCFMSTGRNKRVRLDSQEVSPDGTFRWDESFSLDCIGTKQSVDTVLHGMIVFQLRWRSNTDSLFRGSRLLGRAEVSWRDVFESPSMEMERWVMMKQEKKVVKTPSVRIGMKIVVPSGGGLVERKMKKKWDESCGCCHGDCCNNTCLDSEFFVIGAALDVF